MPSKKRVSDKRIRALLCASLLLLGCPPSQDSADDAVDAGKLPREDEGGPLVEVLLPTGALDPNGHAVLVDSTVETTCRVAPRSPKQRIDSSSVEVRVYAGEEPTPAIATGASAKSNGTFAATISLDAIPEGKLRFECSAVEASSAALVGVGEITTYFDRGPGIEFVTPQSGSAVARGSQVLILFRVTERPLSNDDAEAAVSSVRLRVNGEEVSPRLDEDGTTYSHAVDLTDLTTFPPATASLQIRVEATNARTPEAATRLSDLEVAVDGEGPEITIKTPDDSTFVGQRADVVARVEDGLSGVKSGSVRTMVVVDDVTDVFSMSETGAKNEYAASFQTTPYNQRTQLTINVIAEDNAGNETRSSRIVLVDSVPPFVSLDPPPMRIGTEKDLVGLECSAPFDPVGSDALNDGDVLPSLFSRFRAVIWERGLVLDGQTIVRVSDVDDESAGLYVQGRPEVPLIIDSDGDGWCDSIQAEAPPAGPENDPIKVQLQPVRSRGKPEPGANAPATAEPATNGVCALSSGNTPDPLCLDTTMTFVLPHPSSEVGEALYAINPTGSGIACSGDEWQATVDGGWACVAAAASDQSGNLGISTPIRICYDVPSGRCTNAGPAPDCTDGCAMPELSLRGLPNFLVRY